MGNGKQMVEKVWMEWVMGVMVEKVWMEWVMGG